jgi:hypothetical protein
METAITKKYRYFLYSKSQHNMRTEVDKKINKVFSPGKVFNRGQWVMYTEVSMKPTNAFADAKVVAEGYLEDMKYSNPTSVWGAM